MVVNATEHGMQADVIFVIEGTAANGAYFNDLKTNYLIPTLEYFNQGNIEDREYVTENSTTRYGIVIYHAADCLPRPCTDTFGPYSNPHKLLQRLDNLEMVGGRGESHANIAEGLATALICFEDLQLEREPSTASQKHCILVCNSPPYQISVQESYKFLNYTIESLPPVFQKRNINLSIVSPRKIPEFFKLFELAGGDLQSSQTKNYAKDPRNLVLLHNYNLKERPVTPTNVTPVHAAANTVQIPSSPVPAHDSPNTNQPANIPQPPAPQNPAFRNATPINIGVNHGAAPAMTVPMNPGRPVFNPQITAPPNYHPARAPQARWRTPFIAPGATVQSNNQGSALIAQLTQPPTALTGINVPFNQRMDANGMQPSAPAPQAPQQNQQAQLTPQQQQQIRNMQLQQQQQQQLQQQTMQIAPMTVSSTGTSGPTPVQQTVTQTTAAAPQHQPAAAVTGQVATRERPPIWQGVLEWLEKAKNPTDSQKQTRQVPCQVSANAKDNEPELKADSWPHKLIMQLMPKQLIGSIGGAYLKNSRSVLFHPTPCDALDSLTKVMSTGFAGCVHFTSAPALPACEIKVLILLYTAEKRAYLGFIPNDQTAFVDRLRKVIQHQKTSHAATRGQIFPPSAGGAGGPSTATSIPPQMPPAGGIVSQGGIMMSQTNTMTMGGGQITQVATQQQGLSNQQPNQGQMNLQGAMAQQGVENSGGGMISGHQQQQRQMYENNFEVARQQNLMKIHQLKQTLEAAQQQEAQYKSQLEVNIQQNLEVAQQQEMQFKQQIEAQQQAQRGLNPNAGMAGQQPNTQRMMRPVMASNLQLRHLLQQQHNPQQYRQQVLGMQQQMVGPRGQMNVRPINNSNQPNQQFDDVSNYDFLG
ncbi:mediator of RNA polymerase II transcription subunit 25 [Microplitis demolitor]|uniref:mediator of RNA polymerase II transcription subunit 25 n=1 Tax=Microplitis demolitor TaxID=69319 RepID=UPI000440027F|nr:mediator of RNA polymerase II transcription subunit 25 [Microplitis demolitor]